MPAEIRINDHQQRASEQMASIMQKHTGDVGQTAPTLTYALAAKGRSPSVPSLPPNGKGPPDSTENGVKRSSSSSGSRDITTHPTKAPSKNTVTDTQLLQVDDVKTGEEERQDQTNINKDVNQSDSAAGKPSSAVQPQLVPSTPSSPEYGVTSTSSLPKEEDAFSAMNGSSESTWDKQSQTSQNGCKEGEKTDVEKGQSTKIPWDDEAPPSVSLKEAPPPSVNFWQQRALAQRPKPPTLAQPPKPAVPNLSPGNSNGAVKGTEATTEPKKQDSKKKGRAGAGSLDERPAQGTARIGSKLVEAADKSSLALAAPPPPPGDATSWPAPESVPSEAKKKTPERVEKDDKETSQPPKPHKEKWVPMQLDHSVLFETPFPPARRGGKTSRGGREGGGRGANTANSSNISEKSTTTGVGTSASQNAPVSGLERGRTALNSTTSNASLSKSKRASSAGPATPRDQRKLGDSSATDKRNNLDHANARAGQGNNNSNAKESRKPSVSAAAKDTQTEWSSRVVPVNGGPNTKSVQSATDEDRKNPGSASEALVSSGAGGGSERRSEGSIRPPDFAREFQGSIPMRERGEGRPERARGGYRGRGGPNHAFFNSNLPNGHGFPNGQQLQYQPTQANSAKSQPNQESSTSHPQNSYYQTAQQYGKHHRSSSRSQSIPHSTPYSRFPNGHLSGSPHLANLQTDVANDYSFQSGNNGIMSAIPYQPWVEIPVFGMVSMQM